MTPLFWWTKSTGWAWDTFHSSQNANNSLASLMKSKETRNSVFYFWLQKGVRFTTYSWHPDHTPSGRQCSQMEELGHAGNLGFIPTPVLMYSTLASELLSVSSISLRNTRTYATHSSSFPQVAHSRAMPISALSLLYPGALTQAPAFTPLVVHSSQSCWMETGTSTCLRRERMMLCSLPLPVEISWLLQPIFSDARCAALLIDKNCYINFKVITICQNYRSTGLQP